MAYGTEAKSEKRQEDVGQWMDCQVPCVYALKSKEEGKTLNAISEPSTPLAETLTVVYLSTKACTSQQDRFLNKPLELKWLMIAVT